MRFRLYKSQIAVTKTLKKLNIPFIQPTAGLFIWTNLRNVWSLLSLSYLCMIIYSTFNNSIIIYFWILQYLKEMTLEAEANLWLNLLHKGVYVMPGYAFGCAERGWFRIVFSDHDNIVTVG